MQLKQSFEGLHPWIKGRLIEWDPALKNDPQKLQDIASAVEQDFYALAQKNPQLMKQSMKALEPLMEYIMAKQLEIHTNPRILPNPMQKIRNRCDDLIKALCKDDPELAPPLLKAVHKHDEIENDPKNPNIKAHTDLLTLSLHLKESKDNKQLSPSLVNTLVKDEVLSDADKAIISVYGNRPHMSGANETTITESKPSPFVIQALTKAITLTLANKFDDPSQTRGDEFREVQEINEEKNKSNARSPFNIDKGPTPFDH